MNELRMPPRDKVASVRLAISCEAIVQRQDDDDSEARIDVRNYFQPIVDALKGREEFYGDGPVWIGEEAEGSEYDADLQVVAGSFFGEVTLEEWDRIADGYCLDVPGDAVLPTKVEPTLGILDTDGITPAVAIPHTEEGYGTMWREPALIASFYVAVRTTE